MRYNLLKKIYDKSLNNLKDENDYMKQLILEFLPDKEYYK